MNPAAAEEAAAARRWIPIPILPFLPVADQRGWEAGYFQKLYLHIDQITHTHTHSPTYRHIHAYTGKHTHTHACSQTLCTLLQTYIHTYIHLLMYVYMLMYVWLCVHMYARKYVCLYYIGPQHVRVRARRKERIIWNKLGKKKKH